MLMFLISAQFVSSGKILISENYMLLIIVPWVISKNPTLNQWDWEMQYEQ